MYNTDLYYNQNIEIIKHCLKKIKIEKWDLIDVWKTTQLCLLFSNIK